MTAAPSNDGRNTVTCLGCGEASPAGARFCPACGAKLGRETQPPVSESPGTSGGLLLGLEPVLVPIARTAARLCDARNALIYLVNGSELRLAAKFGSLRDARAIGHKITLSRGGPGGRAVLERRTVHVGDLAVAARTRFPDTKTWQRATGWRTVLATPLLRHDVAIGAILILRTKVQRFTPKQVALLRTFAEQAAVAIENTRLSGELQTRNHDLAEALEQQTATADILRIISTSPTNLAPVLNTVIASAARFCGAYDASMFRLDGENLRADAHHGPVLLPGGFLVPVVRGTVAGRSVIERRAVSVADLQVETEEFPEGSALARQTGQRATLSAPLLREGAPIGTILLRRAEAVPFTDKQIALLQTFADQAVIAIENVRLFKELQARNTELTESLARQTATGEVLRANSRAQSDAQPVFEIIAASAFRLCGAAYGSVQLYDGELMRMAALENVNPEGVEAIRRVFPMRPDEGTAPGRAILTRSVVQIPDVLADSAYQLKGELRTMGFRSLLGVPMLRDGEPIGTIVVGRAEPGLFAATQIALLQTFADQAVIAIENVRLFRELEARNRDLTEALDQQTATGEILRVISSSPTDVQPVFDAIARHGVALCDGIAGLVVRYDGVVMRMAAYYNVGPEGRARHETEYPRPPDRTVPLGVAILDRTIVHVPNLQTATQYAGSPVQRSGRASMIAVPLLRKGEVIGAIGITSDKREGFSDRDIALLRSFADQAVIAIENVRLFKELEGRNVELTDSLARQTATAEVLRVISQSQTDIQPVFDTILRSSIQLCEGIHGVVVQYDGEMLRLVAEQGFPVESLAELQKRFPRRADRDILGGRCVIDRRVIHIPDLENDPTAPPESVLIARAGGYRGLLAVPMMRGEDPIGSIILSRGPVAFTDKQIELVKTFADQAVIAIENVRLFKELEARHRDLTESLEQQTSTSRILQVISSSPTDVQPVFETIIESAVRLCNALMGAVFQYDGELVHFTAGSGFSPTALALFHQSYPRPLDKDRLLAPALLEGRPANVPDVLELARSVVGQAELGYRSALYVPIMREGMALGIIAVGRLEVGAFPETQVKLLQTFADQAVIAIENVRLFKELEARNRDLTEALEQQTATSEVLKTISRSAFDLEPVFETVAENAVRLCGAQRGLIYRFDGQVLRVAAFYNVSL